MTRLKTRHRAFRLLITVMALGMAFLPTTAFAQDAPAEPTITVTQFPLLGSNITIELTTSDDGAIASVVVEGQPADFTLEQDDDGIELRFVVTNANGSFDVEVKFEDDERKIEIESDGPAVPGDYVWSGEACAGGAISVAYTIAEDGTLVLGAIDGSTAKVEGDDDDLEVRFADGTTVEIDLDDELSIEQKCDDDSDDNSDDDSDDNDSDDEDADSDDADSDDDDSDDDK